MRLSRAASLLVAGVAVACQLSFLAPPVAAAQTNCSVTYVTNPYISGTHLRAVGRVDCDITLLRIEVQVDILNVNWGRPYLVASSVAGHDQVRYLLNITTSAGSCSGSSDKYYYARTRFRLFDMAPYYPWSSWVVSNTVRLTCNL